MRTAPARRSRTAGPVVEPKTGRTYFLDYPCDLKPGEKVTLVLSLHGGGSYGNWQRHYFPILDSGRQASPRGRDAVHADPRLGADGRRISAEHHGLADRADRREEHQIVLARRTQLWRHDVQPHRLHRLLQGQGRRLALAVRRADRSGGNPRRFRSRRARRRPRQPAGAQTPPAPPRPPSPSRPSTAPTARGRPGRAQPSHRNATSTTSSRPANTNSLRCPKNLPGPTNTSAVRASASARSSMPRPAMSTAPAIPTAPASPGASSRVPAQPK